MVFERIQGEVTIVISDWAREVDLSCRTGLNHTKVVNPRCRRSKNGIGNATLEDEGSAKAPG